MKKLSEMSKLLLQRPDLRDSEAKFQRFSKLVQEPCKGPIDGHFVFLDEAKKKEWDEMPEDQKHFVTNHLSECCSMMESKVAIDMLCHVINDLLDRIQKLEEKSK